MLTNLSSYCETNLRPHTSVVNELSKISISVAKRKIYQYLIHSVQTDSISYVIMHTNISKYISLGCRLIKSYTQEQKLYTQPIKCNKIS